MKDQIVVPIVQSSGDNNAVVVSIDKINNHVVMTLCPAEQRNDGVLLISVMQGKYVKLEPMTRLNRKRIDFWHLVAKENINYRRGQVWDEVSAFLIENEFKIKNDTRV